MAFPVKKTVQVYMVFNYSWNIKGGRAEDISILFKEKRDEVHFQNVWTPQMRKFLIFPLFHVGLFSGARSNQLSANKRIFSSSY